MITDFQKKFKKIDYSKEKEDLEADLLEDEPIQEHIKDRFNDQDIKNLLGNLDENQAEDYDNNKEEDNSKNQDKEHKEDNIEDKEDHIEDHIEEQKEDINDSSSNEEFEGILAYKDVIKENFMKFEEIKEKPKVEIKKERDACPICFEKIIIGVELNCQHKYHQKCLLSWLQKDHRTCPICRQKIELSNDLGQEIDDEGDDQINANDDQNDEITILRENQIAWHMRMIEQNQDPPIYNVFVRYLFQ